jgi:hypothetical protein
MDAEGFELLGLMMALWGCAAGATVAAAWALLATADRLAGGPGDAPERRDAGGHRVGPAAGASPRGRTWRADRPQGPAEDDLQQVPRRGGPRRWAGGTLP